MIHAAGATKSKARSVGGAGPARRTTASATTPGLGNQATLRRLQARSGDGVIQRSPLVEATGALNPWLGAGLAGAAAAYVLSDLIQLQIITNRAAAAGAYTNPDCPELFCQPYADVAQAKKDWAWAGPRLLLAIGLAVDARVKPLWASYIAGGSAMRDLSADFGADFTQSKTTLATTGFLLKALADEVQTNGDALLGGKLTEKIDFTPFLASALVSINDGNDPDCMDFAYPHEIPGNIAGGIGTDQAAHPLGRTPSTTPDSRAAKVGAQLTRAGPDKIAVNPWIDYTVVDTIDLCPGNCGMWKEQFATMPLSRFEATGLTGDVPFTVRFPAPPKLLAPFAVGPGGVSMLGPSAPVEEKR